MFALTKPSLLKVQRFDLVHQMMILSILRRCSDLAGPFTQVILIAHQLRTTHTLTVAIKMPIKAKVALRKCMNELFEFAGVAMVALSEWGGN
jgi:hypothetical protein